MGLSEDAAELCVPDSEDNESVVDLMQSRATEDIRWVKTTPWFEQVRSDSLPEAPRQGRGSIDHVERYDEAVSIDDSLCRSVPITAVKMTPVVVPTRAPTCTNLSRPSSSRGKKARKTPLSKADDQSRRRVFQLQHEQSERRVFQLQQELDQERSKRHSIVMQVRQDVMLDLCQANDKIDRSKLETRRLKDTLRVLKSNHAADTRNLQGRLQYADTLAHDLDQSLTVEKQKHATAAAEIVRMKEEAEEMEDVLQTLEHDLEDMRRIENEDQVRTADRNVRQDLPPPYGSLDDIEDPPLRIHEDSGAFEVATLKRTVREQFRESVTRAYTIAEQDRRSNSGYKHHSADQTMFIELSCGLRDAARTLCKSLQDVEDMLSIHLTTTTLGDSGTSRELGKRFRKLSARPTYTADRAAKLMIELSFRVLSALEVRPRSFHGFSANARTILGLIYTEVDDVLLQALRLTKQHDHRDRDYSNAKSRERGKPIPGPHRSQMWEMQNYLTQVTALGDKLTDMGANCLVQGYFEQTTEWLSENVEKERELMAQEGGGVGHTRTGSEVSSEAGTHTP